ncbi:MAG: GTPase domain-containing protein [gamma proteobacterium endosymbiont of Lamellibrachia anaximandri]|nr:GTPase domain-containing protein [gamma proteobacterium endosymbiont of Lamellibrachia anaximandri]
MANLLEHLQQLITRLISCLEARQEIPDFESDALIYADALLRRYCLSGETSFPRQLMVVGPTQSGKSSLVNLLLEEPLAEASPLAGFTQHPQGFSTVALSETQQLAITKQFPDWQQKQTLNAAEPLGYTLRTISSTDTSFSVPAIIWDSPDFDSVSSRNYRQRVPVLCAMADLILLVVSREKYADQSVWQLLRLIAPLHTPLLICLNKTTLEEAELLEREIRQRLKKEQIEALDVISLPFVMGDEQLQATQSATELRRAVSEQLGRRPQPFPANHLRQLLQQHWPGWTETVRQEIAAGEIWQSLVEATIDESIALYERDYLDNPHYSDTLQRTLSRLLELIEIPGIAGGLVKARELLSWPARKLQAIYRHRSGKSASTSPDHEISVLTDAVNHLLLRLQREIGEQTISGQNVPLWWQSLLNQFSSERQTIETQALETAKHHQKLFESEIENASQRLFIHLQKHPTTLNSLRAARVTADAAALAFALKTGGIGLNDLILAPAMLSFSTLLTEGALGRYMFTVEQDLKAIQLKAVREQLFADVLKRTLLELPENLSAPGLCRIDQQQLFAAESELEALRQ